ncbi:GGDEF domain-containing protein [Marinobacterium sediminicola]|uniref:Diguanylate cyclase (GGDEF) domain-containing protein n=1 Tax=Marinobacterium sediminicola TaxID=518898 RepID=A0ABY1S4E5_9GAMM|nr:GGDEF domain-containing protein [Marinobacterium sediminicola]ULG68963.1 GGDEF domain-containing protein [Marinobacterium sediminicola]SMR78465.1 diguanylate cyclase (GGDEF) domain-containing protein [Marinobacterium sediminicola]
MTNPSQYDHLVHIETHEELRLYELIPNVVWVFDIDKHGWWWGNSAAVAFWGLDSLQALIDKDLSGDTQGARDRTLQTFELAVREGLTVDPWTTYPNGKPKTLLMMHRAVLLGPDRHRGIIAYINEQVNMGEQPENLLLMEAMRYTRVPATTFTLDGDPVVENPAATDAYNYLYDQPLDEGSCAFVARFADPAQGRACLKRVQAGEEGRWDFIMQTAEGARRHSLDIRRTRHPLNGDFLFLVVEYDFTELYEALEEIEAARARLHDIAMKDALTGVNSLHYMQEAAKTELAHAARHQQTLWLMFIDLDGFKSINDSLGHSAGDEVLCEVARRLQAVIRAEDLLARIGGDEYVVLLSHASTEADTTAVAQRILDRLQEPIPVAGESARVSASIGIARFPDDGADLEALLKAADAAMYRVKKDGKNGFVFVRPGDEAE